MCVCENEVCFCVILCLGEREGFEVVAVEKSLICIKPALFADPINGCVFGDKRELFAAASLWL